MKQVECEQDKASSTKTKQKQKTYFTHSIFQDGKK